MACMANMKTTAEKKEQKFVSVLPESILMIPKTLGTV